MSETIYMIGHSTRPIERFLKILEAHSITMLADIRTVPKSRHNPQFNSDTLRDSLAGAGIEYIHLRELGGLRHASKNSVNTGWMNLSFRGFADYMQTDEFEAGLDRLIKLGKIRIVAIMCAEGNPFRCHRSLVADALTVRGVRAVNIASRKCGKLHALTSFAEVHGHKIRYLEGHAPVKQNVDSIPGDARKGGVEESSEFFRTPPGPLPHRKLVG
jgi:uncharacterized protein (DUF488 family)